MDVVVAVRDAMVPPISVQKPVAKKSAPKSSATQKHGTGHKSTSPPRNLPVEKSSTGSTNVFHYLQCRTLTCYTAIRKTMDIPEEDMEGLDCQLITGGNEEKSDTSADSSLHHDDDQQGIFSSESESDEDLIPPPPTKRKRSNQSVKSLGNTKSKVFFLFYGKKRNLTFIIDFYFIEKFKSPQGKFICHTKKKRKVISEEFFFERRILLWTST
jgi:hypothetical protein